MTDITVIGTYHEEEARSLVTVQALAEIIKRIQPEVIFLEMHKDDYHDHFGFGSFFGTAPRNTLETLAVIEYCRSYPVQLVPVDLPTPARAFFSDYAAMCGQIEVASSQYCGLLNHQKKRRQLEGFTYLNSIDHEEVFVALEREVKAVIRSLGDNTLTAINDLWLSTNKARDEEMLKNIYTYCEQNHFSIGAFLVGSAHRQPLKRKISDRGTDDVQWQFWSE